jgi:selenocysteine lyase/cysteine desulfurase
LHFGVTSSTTSMTLGLDRGSGRILLPDKINFPFDGIYLNAAYTHPLSLPARRAMESYMQSRVFDLDRNWPLQNAREEVIRLYAQLIHADPSELAIVPSTIEGENLIAAALDLGPGAGVVTDALHYDAALTMYGERYKEGMPLTVLAPKGNRIDYSELEAAITDETRLVAVSLVSSDTGYGHDLKRVCEIAHGKGALVYADAIQAVGTIPLDVRATGVDFCCAGTYKWLMGEFGMALLYVRADRLQHLKRVQLGWRALKSFTRHALPFDPPGPPGGEWQLRFDTASLFEVSTANWSAMALLAASLGYISEIGVETIRRHCDPLLQRLQDELPRHGFAPLTPLDCQGPYVVFSREGVGAQFRGELKKARIFLTLYENRIRIAPSVHNDMDEIERLLGILCR